MAWSRTGVVFLALLLLPALGAGAPLTIVAPTEDIYTESNARAIEIETDDYEIVNYSIAGTRCADTFPDGVDTLQTSCYLPDGDYTLTAFAALNGSVVRETAAFRIDTSPPTINGLTPNGTVTVARYPRAAFSYSDLSAVSTVSLFVDGEERNASVEAGHGTTRLTGIEEGEHTVTVQAVDEYGHTGETEWRFRLPVAPIVSATSPVEVVGSSPQLELVAADPAGIDENASLIRLERDGDTVARLSWPDLAADSSVDGTEAVFRHRFQGLADGSYRVAARISDDEGNVQEREWRFTVDTAPPRMRITSHTDGDIITGAERFKVWAADASPVHKVNVSLAGQRKVAVPGEGNNFTVTMDTAAVGEGTRTLLVQGIDAADNIGTTTGRFILDNARPTVEHIDVYPDPASTMVTASAIASDSATNISNVTYNVKPSGLHGVMAPGDGAFDEGREPVDGSVNITGLSDGEYVFYLSAADTARQDSGNIGSSFYVDHNLDTGLAVSSDTQRVVVGGTRSIPVRVQNTGSVDEVVQVSAEGDLDATPSSRKRIDAGEQKQFTVTVATTSQTAAGEHTVTVIADGLASQTSTETPVVVQPPTAEQRQIRERFNTLQDRFKALENRSRSNTAVGPGEVAAEFEDAEAVLENVSTLLEQGRYAAAATLLPAAEERVSRARNTFTGAVTQHHIAQLSSFLLRVLVLVLIAGVIVGGYRFIPAEAGYHPDRGFVHRPDGKHPLRLRVEDWWRRRQAQREERREQEVEDDDEAPVHPVEPWTGFR